MILKYGSDSNSKQAVRALSILIGAEMTDVFTAGLRSSVKQIQDTLGIAVDGVAGPQTFAALVTVLPDVKYGDDSGSIYVRAVQALVSTAIDGKYGKNTRANVLAFQAAAGLSCTGDVARADWLRLWDCGGFAPAARSAAAGVKPVDYKQYDSRWKSKAYTATGSKSQTIGSSGCGPTSMADIMATWVDSRITPVEMCAYAIKHGFRTANSGTAWGFFRSVAQAYGFTGFIQTKAMATAREALKNGALVVASMGPGYWTKGGHYICLWKTDDTYMYANDPASGSRVRQKLGPFEQQRKQFFIFYRPGRAA